ncbi:MAG: hypothetical protein K8H99_01695 [Nitrospirae bacterium]|nr:hypothetical protein [Fimbriimonadaceae bacterium]
MIRLRAYTVVELLTVVVIIMVIAGLVGTAVPAAIGQARVGRAIAHMRQIQTAISLYRSSWDGVEGAATPQAAGLPVATENSIRLWSDVFDTVPELWIGCGAHPSVHPNQAKPSVTSITYFFIVTNADYSDWYGRFGERLPAVFDMHCSPSDVHVNNPYERRRGLAVTLLGNAVNRWSLGEPLHPEFWALQEENP